MGVTRVAVKRAPPGVRKDLRIKLDPAEIERLEAYCMRRATIPPFVDLKPSTVATRAVRRYLAELEAEEVLLPSRRAKPACVFAVGAGLTRWCPEHDVRWEVGDAVPESCRGDG